MAEHTFITVAIIIYVINYYADYYSILPYGRLLNVISLCYCILLALYLFIFTTECHVSKGVFNMPGPLYISHFYRKGIIFMLLHIVTICRCA